MIAGGWAAQVGPAPAALPAEPAPTELYAVVAHLLAGTEAARPPAGDLQRWLEAHDAILDVRLRWLARREVARRAGGDELALARARDAILASLRTGLVPSRDLPGFLRISLSPTERRHLSESLAALADVLPAHAPVCVTFGDPSPEARRASAGYARLTVAWAQARMGDADPAGRTAERAYADIPRADPLHTALRGLFRAAIDQALEGLPPGTAAPPDVRAAYAALPRFERYKLDRLRNSAVGPLRVPGAGNPFLDYVDHDEAAAWPAYAAEQQLAAVRQRLAEQLERVSQGHFAPQELVRLLASVPALDPAEAPGVLDDVLDLAPQFPPLERVPVLVEAMAAAAAIRAPRRVEGLLSSLAEGLHAMLAADPGALADALQVVVRALVRCGLGAQARPLVRELYEACPDREPLVRLRLAAAAAVAGDARPHDAAQALAMFQDPTLLPTERVQVASAAADLAATGPLREAVAGWRALADAVGVPDTFTTNSHFALSYLLAVDALVAAHVHPDRLLGEAGRRALDAEEHAIRLQILEEERQ